MFNAEKVKLKYYFKGLIENYHVSNLQYQLKINYISVKNKWYISKIVMNYKFDYSVSQTLTVCYQERSRLMQWDFWAKVFYIFLFYFFIFFLAFNFLSVLHLSSHGYYLILLANQWRALTKIVWKMDL